MYDDVEYTSNETAAPLNAPHWTKSGYNGIMLNLITEAVQKGERDKFILPSTSASQDMIQDFALVDMHNIRVCLSKCVSKYNGTRIGGTRISGRKSRTTSRNQRK